MEVPINPGEYYPVAVEANGNLTVARRDDGQLLLFAPDHDFSHVTPFAGSPPELEKAPPDDGGQTSIHVLACALEKALDPG